LKSDKKIIWKYFKRFDNVESDYEGHGSCVLSKLAGATHGVAKKPTIVIVKLAPKMTAEMYIDGFKSIMQDIMTKGRTGGKAVINMSQGVELSKFSDELRKAFRDTISAFSRQDVPLIVSSGNNGGVSC
jgi:hypothetical protein